MKQNDIQRVLDSHISVMNPAAPDPEAILNHIHTKRRASLRKRRTLLIVVTLLLASMVAAQALGFPILQKLIWWDQPDELVWFFELEDPIDEGSRIYTAEERSTWGDELCDTLEEYNCHVCLPTWKPEGYELSDDNYVVVDEYGGMINFMYLNSDEHTLILDIELFPTQDSFDWCSSKTTFILNEDEEPKIYNINGREIWWGKNTDDDSIFWTDVSGIVNIFGNHPFGDENVERMIQSISPD